MRGTRWLRLGLAVALLGVTAAAFGTAGAAAAPTPTRGLFSLTAERRAELKALRSGIYGGALSGSASSMLDIMLKGTPSPEPDAKAAGPSFLPGPLAPVAEVRVNDPADDGYMYRENTTQSEPTLTMAGSNIVVAFNDDGAFTTGAGTGFTGYATSTDGGTSFTDHLLPQPPGFSSFGDPVLATDRSGEVYLSTLAGDFTTGLAPIVVYRSSDSGQTFPETSILPQRREFAFSDKEWMTVGPNPANLANDVLYVASTEFSWKAPVIVLSRSVDGGATWSRAKVIAPADVVNTKTRFRATYGTGVSLAVDPATGRLYAAWEETKLSSELPDFESDTHRIMLISSDDAGRTFTAPVKIGRAKVLAGATQACGRAALGFGPSSGVRVQSFPTIAVGFEGRVFATFDATSDTGVSRVVVSMSGDGGSSWTRTRVPSTMDAFMPSVAADDTGVSVTYYERTRHTALTTNLATAAATGGTFTAGPLASTDFGVPSTNPNFDPLIAPCYMGDYNAVLRSAGTTYAVWGDNRDLVVNPTFPSGRPDPNVYFGKV